MGWRWGGARFVIVVRPRDYPAPRWMVRLFGALFLLMGVMASVVVGILLYAAVCIALGIG